MTERLSKGIRVLDAGCGRGSALNKMAALYPRSRFVGMDLSEEAIQFARREAREAGLDNVEFLAADLSDFDESAEPESFDFITTFDAIHDQARPLRVLEGIQRALKSDGVYLMQDINGTSRLEKDLEHPAGTFLYAASLMHCMTVSLAQGGEGLGTMWGEEKTREYLLARIRNGHPVWRSAPYWKRCFERLPSGGPPKLAVVAVHFVPAPLDLPSEVFRRHPAIPSDPRLVPRRPNGPEKVAGSLLRVVLEDGFRPQPAWAASPLTPAFHLRPSPARPLTGPAIPAPPPSINSSIPTSRLSNACGKSDSSDDTAS
ncbi:MAG TPA: class I SAM-dependent methyltransferase, partial [Vicinamibacteria bacterium]|nr:class I SAM-dependent methyltransferase [Vicinamibacteria bacterium]